MIGKTIQRLLLLCMVVGLAAGCSKTDEPPVFSLSGRVTDSRTQESLSGITVMLYQKSYNSRGESRQYGNQTTGSSGEYLFDGLPGDLDSWSLTATASGYYDYDESITIANRDGRNTQDIQMTFILTLTASNINFTSAAGSHTFSVASSTSWTIEKSVTWLTVSPASGSGNGTVTVTAVANTSGSPRTGIINVTGGGITQTVTVTQAGVPVFNNGSGTQSDPYLISSKADMETLASKVNGGEKYSGKYFRLTCSLTGTNALTTSVGSWSINSFAGIFDGNGYEIELNNAPNGVFGSLKNATVQNLGVIGKISSTTNSYAVGGICGFSSSSTIASCYNMASISASDIEYVFVGGICGRSHSGTITNCFNMGAVSAASSTSSCNVGGICGYLSFTSVGESNILNCYNTGNVSATSSTYYCCAGGICGSLHGNGSSYSSNILNCYNTGNVSAVTQASNQYYPQAGGISGDLSVYTSIKYCFSANERIEVRYSTSFLNAPRVGRITSDSVIGDLIPETATLSKNYASSIMLLNDNNIISSDASNINGAGTLLSNFKSQTWIQSNLGWDFNTVWKISADQYPTLRMSNN